MVRLVIIILFFLFSLLCILKAPTYHLWLAAIVVGEFPWIFIGGELALLFWNSRADRFQAGGYVLVVLSMMLYASPIVRAYAVSYNLSRKLSARFGSAGILPSRDSPFQFTKMFSGRGADPVSYERMTYAARGRAPLTLDFYKGQGKGNRPCVIVIHGGSWESGDSQQLPELNSVLARNGYSVASINYRLAPEFKSPAPEEDVHAALEFLRLRHAELAIDMHKFILLGRSAGGQIALTAAYRLKEPGVKGVIGFYAPADMAWGYTQPANPMIMDSRKVMEEYLGGTDQTFPEAYYTSTALNYVTPSSVPTLLIHGRNDVLVYYEHSLRLSRKLEKNHVPHFLLTWPWGTHGSDYSLNGPAGQLSTYAVLHFLRTTVPVTE